MGSVAIKKVIEFLDVHKAFGQKEVLKGVSFSVMEGEILFILGVSGTGKSVLLKNLVGLMRPDSGVITVGSTDLSTLDEESFSAVRRQCGMVFQHPALFDSLTVYENVAFGLRRLLKLSEPEIKERVNKSLALVHLRDVQEMLPGQISFGMQKRVSIARTIAIEPRILLFDEPTTGLDPITTRAINELIKSLSDSLGVTSIVVSHDMRCAMDIATRIIVLDRGDIVEQGSPSGLRLSQNELVQEFLAELSEGDHG